MSNKLSRKRKFFRRAAAEAGLLGGQLGFLGSLGVATIGGANVVKQGFNPAPQESSFKKANRIRVTRETIAREIRRDPSFRATLRNAQKAPSQTSRLSRSLVKLSKFRKNPRNIAIGALIGGLVGTTASARLINSAGKKIDKGSTSKRRKAK